MKWLQQSLVRTAIGTLGTMIVLFFSLWFGKHMVPVDKAVPSVAMPSNTSPDIEYVMEKVGTKKVQPAFLEPTNSGGYWVIEHYRQFEYHYDDKGRFLYKNPTGDETYLRYWHQP
ncbi:MAG: hypothetical protein WB502_14380 [Thermoactinomyces sp.]